MNISGKDKHTKVLWYGINMACGHIGYRQKQVFLKKNFSAEFDLE